MGVATWVTSGRFGGSGLGMVIRIQVNVFGREVAGPEGDGGIALLQANHALIVFVQLFRHVRCIRR